MDWYSWLLKSPRLDRSLVYEYSILLSHNELEEDDIAHFDHEFLLSMGVHVAKHRLEILKLAKTHRRRPARPAAALLTAIHKACNCLTRYVHDAVYNPSRAVVVMPRPGVLKNTGGDHIKSLMTRSRRLAMVKKGRLMITDAVCNGVKAVQLGQGPALPRMSPAVGNGVKAVQHGRGPALQSTSPMALLASREEGHDDGFTWDAEGQMRWDSMFQDLKPT